MRMRLLAFLTSIFTLFLTPAHAQRYLEMIDAGTYSVAEIQREAEAYFDQVGRGKGSGYKPYKRWEYVALREMDESGIKISNQELSRQAREFRASGKQKQNFIHSFNGGWKQVGPTYWNATSGWNPGIGHVTSIGIEEANTNHIIVGSPTGGVWKTLDGGESWTALTDEFSTVDVYALEISPYNNQKYFWGSTNGRIYVSNNGGATWAASGNLSGGGDVNRILFHPTDPNVIYAVSKSSGLHRSVNGGANWSPVTGLNGVPGYDVEFKPGDPTTIYFSGIKAYRSTNGGMSFDLIPGLGTENNNYKMLAVTPANPNYVYLVEANGGRFGAFYKSTDSGASYTKLIDGADINYFGYSETGDDDRGQAPRNMEVVANPFNPEEVHIAGIHTWKSINGGNEFQLTSFWTPGTAAALGVGYNHADIDIMRFVGNDLYIGSDGGIFVSYDNATTFQDLSTNLCIRELYKIGVSKTDPNLVSGGSQDNGTSLLRGATREWVDWLGADGMETFIDWSDPQIIYGTSQYGSMYRSDDQGDSATDIAKPEDVDGAWVTPFEQDPIIPTTIYVGFKDVWRSDDRGDSWTKISNYDNKNMNEMKIAPSDNLRIYVSSESNLYTTPDGGGTWATATKAWGSGNINYIAVHPQDAQRLLIVTAGGVYHSTDAGNSWTNISTGLPSGTKYCAAWENTGKNGIYVGIFGNVAYTNDELAGQWILFSDGLPNVRVYELEVNYVSNTIFAGTYGRGLWESPIYDAPAPVTSFSADRLIGCHELTVTFKDQTINSPKSWEWTFEGGDPATSNEQHPTVTYSTPGTFSVTLKTANHAGENTYVAQGYVTVYDPVAPTTADVERCEAGFVTLEAQGQAGEQINWYASASDDSPLFTGSSFTDSISQTTTFYVSAGSTYPKSYQVGPVSNTIGNGSYHGGNFYLVMDALKPFRLKSAKVYASGSANRKFQLRDAANNVIVEKTVFVNDGESRITLDIDVPAGTGWRVGCPSPANLYRNSSGVSYPYVVDGLMKITGSTSSIAGYYYYLYDIEVEGDGLCESERVPVTAVVKQLPNAPVIASAGPSFLCPGDSLLLDASNICQGCEVLWSTGATGAALLVTEPGNFYAQVVDAANGLCTTSGVSNTIAINAVQPPTTAALAILGSSPICEGETLQIQVVDPCQGCTISWSTGENGSSISVSTAGTYTAVLVNQCGTAPATDTIAVAVLQRPAAPIIEAAGATEICPGDSIVLHAAGLCPDCSVLWSTGQTDNTILVSGGSTYSAVAISASAAQCGESLVSNLIQVNNLPLATQPVILLAGPSTLCPGDTALLSAQPVCPGCTVLWSNGATEATISVTSAGAYTCTFANECGNGPVSEAATVEFYPPFVPVVEVSNTCHLTAPAGSQYQWYFNGTAITGANSQTLTAQVSGQYHIAMLSPEGCTGVSTALAVEACMTGVNQPDNAWKARLYPNPAKDKVYLEVQLLQASDLRVELFAADGRSAGILFEGAVQSGNSTLELKLPDLPAGMYTFRLSGGAESFNGSLMLLDR